MPSLSKSAGSFGLDSTPIALRRAQERLERAGAVGAVQEDAHVGAHLVDGREVEEAVAVQVGGRRAVDARLRRPGCGSVIDVRSGRSCAAPVDVRIVNWNA